MVNQSRSNDVTYHFWQLFPDVVTHRRQVRHDNEMKKSKGVEHLHQFLARLVDLADHEHLRAVSMIPLVVHRDVNVDHHTLLQHRAVRNTVADDLVDARAAAMAG